VKIVTIRHGKSELDISHKQTATAFRKLVAEYDELGIASSDSPPSATLERVRLLSINTKPFLIASNLKRALDSVKPLGLGVPQIIEPQFRECEMTLFDGHRIRLPVMMWLLLLRCLWFVGYSPNCESFKQARMRAKDAANYLRSLAQEHECVVLMGHGLMNRLIAKELVQLGFICCHKTGRGNWELREFEI